MVNLKIKNRTTQYSEILFDKTLNIKAKFYKIRLNHENVLITIQKIDLYIYNSLGFSFCY